MEEKSDEMLELILVVVTRWQIHGRYRVVLNRVKSVGPDNHHDYHTLSA